MMSAIKQGESMPLQGGHSDTAMSSPITNKRASSAIVRVMMMGTAVAVGVLLLIIAGPSKKMMLTNSSSNVVTSIESEVVAKNAATLHENGPCLVPPAGTAFNPDNSRTYGCHVNPFETCYQYRNETQYCWSKSYWSNSREAFCLCVPIPPWNHLSTRTVVRSFLQRRPPWHRFASTTAMASLSFANWYKYTLHSPFTFKL